MVISMANHPVGGQYFPSGRSWPMTIEGTAKSERDRTGCGVCPTKNRDKSLFASRLPGQHGITLPTCVSTCGRISAYHLHHLRPEVQQSLDSMLAALFFFILSFFSSDETATSKGCNPEATEQHHGETHHCKSRKNYHRRPRVVLFLTNDDSGETELK